MGDYAATLACPRDGSALRATRQAGVLVDECPSCSGVWMEPHVVNCVARDDELTMLGRAVISAQVASTACPRCGVACKPAALDEVGAAFCGSCRGLWIEPRSGGTRRRGILGALP